MTEYANFLCYQWQELDHYRTLDLQCSGCLVFVKNFIERDRVYDFLVGLNSNVENIEIKRRIVGGKNSFYFPLSHHTYICKKVRLYIM